MASAKIEIASASVIGRDHIGPGKNNQDALWIVEDQNGIVGIVCDGCGSGSNSEVGAKIGARLVCEEIRRRLIYTAPVLAHALRIHEFKSDVSDANEAMAAGVKVVEQAMDRVRQDVLANIRVLANGLGGSFAQTVQDYFLFTAIGFVVTPHVSWTFSLGDGTMFINGERIYITPSEGNAPPYMAYGLVETDYAEAPRFCVNRILTTRSLESLLVGSDGLEALVENERTRIPGKAEVIGSIDRLWSDDSFFQNKDALRRFLALANREHSRIDWKEQRTHRENGCLKDDTSVVVLRRIEPQGRDENDIA
jgi:hypothetical protein